METKIVSGPIAASTSSTRTTPCSLTGRFVISKPRFSKALHASVYETCKALENLGFEITYLPVNEQGVVRVEDVEAAIGPETILVSIMQVNNEIGAVQPIEE